MFREVTLGQYYPGDSWVHRLDPRVKLGATLLYVISLFLSHHIYALVWAGLALAIVVMISTVPIAYLAKGIKPLLVIILLSGLLNLFGSQGEVLWEWGILHITSQGIRKAGFIVVRIVFLILGSSIMTATTTPARLADGMEKSLGFLNRLHVPVHDLAMMITIALRFIPILTQELDKIMKAQMARGMDYEEGNLIERAKKLVSILIPLFVAAMGRASDLAMAMEARCYHGGQGRTRLHPLKFQKADYIAWIAILFYMGIMLAIRIHFQ